MPGDLTSMMGIGGNMGSHNTAPLILLLYSRNLAPYAAGLIEQQIPGAQVIVIHDFYQAAEFFRDEKSLGLNVIIADPTDPTAPELSALENAIDTDGSIAYELFDHTQTTERVLARIREAIEFSVQNRTSSRFEKPEMAAREATIDRLVGVLTPQILSKLAASSGDKSYRLASAAWELLAHHRQSLNTVGIEGEYLSHARRALTELEKMMRTDPNISLVGWEHSVGLGVLANTDYLRGRYAGSVIFALERLSEETAHRAHALTTRLRGLRDLADTIIREKRLRQQPPSDLVPLLEGAFIPVPEDRIPIQAGDHYDWLRLFVKGPSHHSLLSDLNRHRRERSIMSSLERELDYVNAFRLGVWHAHNFTQHPSPQQVIEGDVIRTRDFYSRLWKQTIVDHARYTAGQPLDPNLMVRAFDAIDFIVNELLVVDRTNLVPYGENALRNSIIDVGVFPATVGDIQSALIRGSEVDKRRLRDSYVRVDLKDLKRWAVPEDDVAHLNTNYLTKRSDERKLTNFAITVLATMALNAAVNHDYKRGEKIAKQLYEVSDGGKEPMAVPQFVEYYHRAGEINALIFAAYRPFRQMHLAAATYSGKVLAGMRESPEREMLLSGFAAEAREYGAAAVASLEALAGYVSPRFGAAARDSMQALITVHKGLARREMDRESIILLGRQHLMTYR